MVVNMLRAISTMLSSSKEDRVVCAKTMLDEIIKGLDGSGGVIKVPFREPDALPEVGLKEAPKHEAPKTQPKVPPEKEEFPYMISVDEQKQLKPIKNLPLDTEVVLDGKKMTHRNAVGMKFQKIRIVL